MVHFKNVTPHHHNGYSKITYLTPISKFNQSSAWSYSSSMKELNTEEEEKEKKQHVYYGEAIDDEDEAESVWKSILKRKGLPLATKFEYVDTFNKAFDESYCDMLYLTIKEKKKNPEAAKSRGRSTFEWLPPAAPPSAKLSSFFTYEVNFDERKHHKMISGDVNAILYPRCSEAGRKRYNLSKESSKKNDELFKQLQAKGSVPLGLYRAPIPLMTEYE